MSSAHALQQRTLLLPSRGHCRFGSHQAQTVPVTARGRQEASSGSQPPCRREPHHPKSLYLPNRCLVKPSGMMCQAAAELAWLYAILGARLEHYPPFILFHSTAFSPLTPSLVHILSDITATRPPALLGVRCHRRAACSPSRPPVHSVTLFSYWKCNDVRNCCGHLLLRPCRIRSPTRRASLGGIGGDHPLKVALPARAGPPPSLTTLLSSCSPQRLWRPCCCARACRKRRWSLT